MRFDRNTLIGAAVALIVFVFVAISVRDSSGSSSSSSSAVALLQERNVKYYDLIQKLKSKLDQQSSSSSPACSPDSCPVCPVCTNTNANANANIVDAPKCPIQPKSCPVCEKSSSSSNNRVIVLGAPPPPNVDDTKIEGQITMGTSFGQALYRLAQQSDVELMLEIGTWKGGGSTLCLAKGFKEKKSGFLITIEGREEFWLQARKTLSGYPVKCLYGVAVGSDMQSDKQEVRDEGLGVDNHTPESEWGVWHDEERQLLDYHEAPLLQTLCKRRKFDAVFLDGGEFIGKGEYLVTVTRCRPLYLLMHDTRTFKNQFARHDLLNNKERGYKLLQEENVGAGWAIFKREAAE